MRHTKTKTERKISIFEILTRHAWAYPQSPGYGSPAGEASKAPTILWAKGQCQIIVKNVLYYIPKTSPNNTRMQVLNKKILRAHKPFRMRVPDTSACTPVHTDYLCRGKPHKILKQLCHLSALPIFQTDFTQCIYIHFATPGRQW